MPKKKNLVKKNDVFEVVQSASTQAISSKWIITEKYKIVKARLVARGFEEDSSKLQIANGDFSLQEFYYKLTRHFFKVID